VPQGEIPATVADVLNAKWRSRYTFPSSGAASPSGTALAILADRGEVTDAQVIAFDKYGSGGPPSSELIPAVAQGRYAFALWTNAAAVIAQRDEGAPLQVAFSPKLSVLTNVGSGVLAQAPHPNSAKLFTAWLLTPKAQKILTDLYFYGAQPTAPLPKGFPAASQFLNGDLPEDEAYAARITAFQKRRATLAAANH
jgi:iron(III) transport system substrate-binding protein